MRTIQGLLIFTFLLIILSGCDAKDDEKGIVGIWRVKMSAISGRDVGDGKGWFDFKADGTVDTRPRPGAYDSGNYKLIPEKSTLKLFGKQGGIDYTYELEGDALKLSTTLPNGAALLIECERVNDYPITKENDIVPQGPFVQPR